jgi:DNA-binding NarL/FixJ family response regulator
MTPPITVLLVEDHVASGDALADALRTWYAVPPRVGGLAEVSAAIRLQRPSVVLLDLALGRDNALETLPDLVRWYPRTHFIVLTAYDSYAVMEGAMQAGAKGFIPKSATLAEIRRAIDAVAHGDTYRHPSVRRLPPSRESAAPSRLPEADELVVPKPAELEVLTLLRDGVSARAIARRLKLHYRTVEQRIRGLRKRLGGVSRIGLLRWFEEYLARRER